MADTELYTTSYWKMGGGVLVLAALGIPLWAEFHEPGQAAWNVMLAAILIAVAVAAVVLHRFLRDHIDEVGEARFDTHNREQDNG